MNRSSWAAPLDKSIARYAVAVLALFAVALTSLFVYFASQASIIADDYSYFQVYRQADNPISAVAHHYLTHNGRLGQATFFALTFALLGEAALNIVPALMLLIMITTVAYMVRHLSELSLAPVTVSHSLAAVFVIGALVLSPSMFDSYLWLTSSTVYLGGLTFTLITFALIISLSGKDVSIRGVLGIAVLALWAGMFTEPLTICTGIVGFLLFLVGWKEQRVSLRSAGLAVWLGSLAAFALIYFSPGTMARREYYGTEISLSAILKSMPANLSTFAEHSQEWGYLLIGVAALAFWGLTDSSWRTSLRPGRLFILAFTIFTIYFLGQIVIARTGSPDIALRTFTNPAFALAASFAFAVLALTRTVFSYRPSSQLPLAVAAVLAGLALLPSIPYAQTVSQALTMRAEQLELREQSVTHQLTAGGRTTQVELVPLNTPLVSEAVDLNYKDVSQIEWVLEAISTWYGVEPNQVVIGDQPEGYCLPASPLVKPWMACSAPQP